MAKFSFMQQPYYLAVMIFDGLGALEVVMQNTTTTGGESDFYLALSALFVGLVLWSAIYLWKCSVGHHEDSDVDIGGLPLGKKWYYLAILAACLYRGVVGYQMNHYGTGLTSLYGMLWLFSAPLLAVYTWGNYKSYIARNPNAVSISAAGKRG